MAGEGAPDGTPRHRTGRHCGCRERDLLVLIEVRAWFYNFIAMHTSLEAGDRRRYLDSARQGVWEGRECRKKNQAQDSRRPKQRRRLLVNLHRIHLDANGVLSQSKTIAVLRINP